jgi:hypothetical protein
MNKNMEIKAAKKYYVYKFLDANDNVLYVGKTTKKLKYRLSGHYHLPKDCYTKISSIEYCTLFSKIDMDLYELYYINKYKPQYNSFGVCNDTPSNCMKDVKWKRLSSNIVDDFIETKTLGTKREREEQKYIEFAGVLYDELIDTLFSKEISWEFKEQDRDFYLRSLEKLRAKLNRLCDTSGYPSDLFEITMRTDKPYCKVRITKTIKFV